MSDNERVKQTYVFGVAPIGQMDRFDFDYKILLHIIWILQQKSNFFTKTLLANAEFKQRTNEGLIQV